MMRVNEEHFSKWSDDFAMKSYGRGTLGSRPGRSEFTDVMRGGLSLPEWGFSRDVPAEGMC